MNYPMLHARLSEIGDENERKQMARALRLAEKAERVVGAFSWLSILSWVSKFIPGAGPFVSALIDLIKELQNVLPGPTPSGDDTIVPIPRQ